MAKQLLPLDRSAGHGEERSYSQAHQDKFCPLFQKNNFSIAANLPQDLSTESSSKAHWRSSRSGRENRSHRMWPTSTFYKYVHLT